MQTRIFFPSFSAMSIVYSEVPGGVLRFQGSSLGLLGNVTMMFLAG